MTVCHKPRLRCPSHSNHAVRQVSSIEHGGTRPFSNIMAPLTLFNKAPKRKSVAPLAFKNAYLWLRRPSLMKGYETIFQYVVFLCYYTLVFLCEVLLVAGGYIAFLAYDNGMGPR